MKLRINEKNIGNSTLESAPKKRAKKLTAEEMEIIFYIANKVYNAMELDEVTNTFIDEGRIVLSLTGEQMFDLFEANRKLQNQILKKI